MRFHLFLHCHTGGEPCSYSESLCSTRIFRHPLDPPWIFDNTSDWSTRAGLSRSAGFKGGPRGQFARLPVKPAAQAVGGARFLHEISAQAPFKFKIEVLQQPLASLLGEGSERMTSKIDNSNSGRRTFVGSLAYVAFCETFRSRMNAAQDSELPQPKGRDFRTRRLR